MKSSQYLVNNKIKQLIKKLKWNSNPLWFCILINQISSFTMNTKELKLLILPVVMILPLLALISIKTSDWMISSLSIKRRDRSKTIRIILYLFSKKLNSLIFTRLLLKMRIWWQNLKWAYADIQLLSKNSSTRDILKCQCFQLLTKW